MSCIDGGSLPFSRQDLQKAPLPPRSWPRNNFVLKTCAQKARTAWQGPRSKQRQLGKHKWSKVRADTKLGAFCSPYCCKGLWSHGEIGFASPQELVEDRFASLTLADKAGLGPASPAAHASNPQSSAAGDHSKARRSPEPVCWPGLSRPLM